MTDSQGSNISATKPNEEHLIFGKQYTHGNFPLEPMGHIPTPSSAPTCLIQITQTVQPNQEVQTKYKHTEIEHYGKKFMVIYYIECLSHEGPTTRNSD